MPPSKISALSYEEARDELVRVVGELEQGQASLEESIALWERGEALAQRCEEWLIGAKARLDAARSGASGATASDTARTGGAGLDGAEPGRSDGAGTALSASTGSTNTRSTDA